VGNIAKRGEDQFSTRRESRNEETLFSEGMKKGRKEKTGKKVQQRKKYKGGNHTLIQKTLHLNKKGREGQIRKKEKEGIYNPRP